MAQRKSKAGRPAKPGKRTPTGQLSRAGRVKSVMPNDRVLAKREAFAWFKGGGSAESYDPIGRGWLAGLLDGHGIAPERFRDAGRSYADDYWQYYGKTGLAMADLEPEARGSGARKAIDSDFIPEDPTGEWLETIDRLLLRAGRHVRDALHNVAIDQFFLPDNDPPWLARLIRRSLAQEREQRIKDKRLPASFPAVVGAMPSRLDETKLASLIVALRILVTGRITVPEAPCDPAPAPAPLPPLPAIDPAFLTEEGRMRERADIADIIRERHTAASPQGETA